jgi:DNA-binding SARP family transcriptional activator
VINYTVLGPVTARDGEWKASLLPQHRLLLARLVVAAGKPVPRAELAEMLWEQDEKGPPDHALTRVVHELRKQLRDGPDDDPVPVRGDAYYLQLKEQQADVLRFRAKVRASRGKPEPEATRLLREASSEWGEGGGLSGGLPIDGLAGTWAVNTQRSLRQEYRDVRLACLKHDLVHRGHGRVAEECLRLSIDTEALHCELFVEYWMIATYRVGDRLGALGIYERAAAVVQANLGISLSRRLHRLAEVIQAEDPSLDGPEDPLAWATSTSNDSRTRERRVSEDKSTSTINNYPGTSVNNQFGHVQNVTFNRSSKPDGQM